MDWTVKENMVSHLFFCATQAAEGAIPHLYKQERKYPTSVRLSLTQVVLYRAIPTRWVPMSEMKVRRCTNITPMQLQFNTSDAK